jgi:hypothetical protein
MAKCNIQELVNSGISLQAIMDYADNHDTFDAPTVEDYENAGIVGVDDGNIETINNAIKAVDKEAADTIQEIQEIVNDADATTAALSRISNYANDSSIYPMPEKSHYEALGITGVTDDNLATINSVIDVADKVDADSVNEIQKLVDSGIALQTIKDYAEDSENSTPTVADYTKAGVVGVTPGNLSAVNKAINNATVDEANTLDNIQNIINVAVDAANAVDMIAKYAEQNGQGTVPTVEIYQKAGVKNVNSENIDEVNAKIANQTKDDADTAAEIQGIVNSVNALNKIESYAESSNNSTPTVEDYAKAGITGVTNANLEDVNAAVEAKSATDVDTVDELQDVVNAAVTSVAAVDLISNYAKNDGQADVPDAQDYIDAGITIPEGITIAEVNAAIADSTEEDANTAAEIQDIVDGVVAGNKIEAYAEDDTTNPKPTVSDYEKAGVVGVTANNLDKVNKAIADAPNGKADVDTLDELQAVVSEAVTSIAAVKKISEYALKDGDSDTPSELDYSNAGVSGVTSDNLAEVNAAVAAVSKDKADTSAEIQTLVNSVNALNKIEAYADDSTNNPAPTVDDYKKAGVVGVTAANLDYVNTAIDAKVGSQVDTLEEVQAIISDAVASVDAIDTIVKYADSNGTSLVVPTADTYSTAGITIPTNVTVDELNDEIADLNGSDVDTASEIQELVTSISSLNKIEAYADDSTNNPAPTVADYKAAGVSGITTSNLEKVNAAVDLKSAEHVDTLVELQAVINKAVESVAAVNKIEEYANQNGTVLPAPTLDDYKKAGITVPEGTTAKEINEIIKGLNGDDVDSAAEIQEVVNSVVALNKVEAYADDPTNNPAPTVSDYETAGAIRVNSDNLSRVNDAVKSASKEDVDTVEELQSLINGTVDEIESLNEIVSYAKTNGTSPADAPDADDYEKVGVKIPTGTTVDEINKMVASLNGEDVDSPKEIQAIVNSISSGNKIENYADNDVTNPTPTVSDYETAGVKGVTASNLDYVNASIAAVEREDVDTTAEIQSLINKAVESVAAVSKIEVYAQNNGTGPAPTLDDYKKAGVTIPEGITASEVNEIVKDLNAEEVDSAAEIQEVVNSVVALNKIEAYADDSTNNPAPTVSDYETAGVTGITTANLEKVNGAVAAKEGEEVDTLAELQAVINKAVESVAAVSKIEEYANQNGTVLPAPTLDDYKKAGVTVPEGTTAKEINAIVKDLNGDDVDSAVEIQDVVNSVVALNKVEAYAEDPVNNPAPTVSDYEKAGVTGVTTSNVGKINEEVAKVTKAEVDTLEELQLLIDEKVPTAAAVSKIEEYANQNGTSDAPEIGDYRLIGVDTGITSEEDALTDEDKALISEINAAIAALNGEDVDTAAEIQEIVNSVASGNIIEDYAEDPTNNQAPTLDDYIKAGVIRVTTDNLDYVNEVVAAAKKEDVDTLEELQTLINGAVESVAAVNAIATYAQNNGTGPAPTLDDYKKAGVTIPEGITASEVNEIVKDLNAEEVDSAAEIQEVVNSVVALNKIEAYADDSTNNPAPTVSDYETAGVTGITTANLEKVNGAVAAKEGEEVDTLAELQAVINKAVESVAAVSKIEEYANQNGTVLPAPTLDDYKKAGVTVPEGTTAKEINAIVKDLNGDDVDSAVEIQDVVNSVVALNKVEAYAEDPVNNPAPTVSDYEKAGVTGVTTSNVGKINEEVAKVTKAEVDTLEELQLLIDEKVPTAAAVSKIEEYANQNGTSDAPEIGDYRLIGVDTGITSEEDALTDEDKALISEINAAIAALNGEDVDTAAEIQEIVNSVASGNIIEDYAEDPTNNQAPTLDDYIKAGVVGVTEDNLEYVNAAVSAVGKQDVDTTEELQSVINGAVASVASVDRISNYAESNGTSETPNILDYAKAGVEGVTESSIAEINEMVATLDPEDVDTKEEIQGIINGVNSLNKIEEYAHTNGQSEAPGVADYEAAGVVGVTTENLTSVNDAVKAVEKEAVDTSAELQTVINSVSSVAAVDKIEEYAEKNGTSTPPTAEDYKEAGINTGIVDPKNLTDDEKKLINEINELVATLDPEDVDTVDEIQDVIDSVKSLNVIEKYAEENGGSTAPSKEDYAKAGIVGVTTANLTAVNDKVAAATKEAVDTPEELQALINSITSVKSVDVISEYADANGTSTPPTAKDYTNAGVNTGVSNPDSLTEKEQKLIEQINEKVATLTSEDVDTKDEIQDIVDAIVSSNKIKDYAEDPINNPAPTPEDYENVGIEIPTGTDIDDINNKIKGLNPEDVDTVDEIEKIIEKVVTEESINKIEEYAADQTKPAPTKDDYTNAGVNGVTTDGLANDLNTIIATLDSEDVDTAVEIQNIVDAVVAGNIIEAYADNNTTNPTPTVADYEAAGVVGLTPENLNVVNTAVAAKVAADVDTVDELQDVINKAVTSVAAVSKIESYADNPVPANAPGQIDYANAGVDGVSSIELVNEVNAVLAQADVKSEDVDTAAEIQDIVNGVLAGNKIEAYADNDTTNEAPSVQDYIDAGVVGVTADNLDDVNAAVAQKGKTDVDTVDELQGVINLAVKSVAAVDKVKKYAEDPENNDAPNAEDYKEAGIDTGVKDPKNPTPEEQEKINEINELIGTLDPKDVDTPEEIQDVIKTVEAGNKIEEYADNSTNPVPTVSDYEEAGVVGVNDGNIDAVNAAVDAAEKTDVDTITKLQELINNAVESVVSVDTISEYAESNGTTDEPTIKDYANIGLIIPEGTTVDEINEVIATLDPEDVDTAQEIKDIIDSVGSLNKIEEYASSDGTSAKPTVADYEAAGVVGVTTDNLSDVNDKVKEKEAIEVDTAEELQAIINAVDGVGEVNKVKNYAESNGTTTPPTAEDYEKIGIDTGVEDPADPNPDEQKKIDEINELIATLDPEDVDTPEEIQELVKAVEAGNKIEDYAHDDTANPAPTLKDYEEAGVVGVTADNLAAVNTAVAVEERDAVDTVEELQAVINAAVVSVASVSKIEEYADSNGTSKKPEITDYTKAGIDGVDENNIDEINELIATLDPEDVDSAAEIQDVVNAVEAGNKIENYAENDTTNPAPSVADYEEAGVVGVTANNIDAVNAAVAAVSKADVDTVEELQDVINNAVESVDAVNTIVSYAKSNGTSDSPTINTYAKAGINDVDDSNLYEVNAAIAALDAKDVDSAAEVQNIIDAVNALNKIEDYADDSSNDKPTVADYEVAGVVGVTVDNLALVNQAVDAVNGDAVDTVEELQDVINSVESVDAVDTIENYAKSNGTSTPPTAQDYKDAGIDTGIDNPTDLTDEEKKLIDEINELVASLDPEDVDTPEEIQEVVKTVEAGNKIEDYAASEANPKPTVADYEAAGVTGVNSDNLDEVNDAVKAVGREDVDTLEELQSVINKAVESVATVNKIKEYANSNGTSDTPTVDDYTKAGVTIPDGTTVEEINKLIESLEGENVDSASEIQDIVNKITAGNKIENYAADDTANPVPMVSDYEAAGVVGVITDNLDAVNAAVAAVGREDVDTLEELQSVINSAVESVDALNRITEYANSNGTDTEPSISDYIKVGIDGVDSSNIDEINEAISKLNAEDVNSAAEIQDIVQAVNALNTIEAYADDDTANPTPTVTDYINAGVVGVTASNIDAVNSAVKDVIGENVDTLEELQALVSGEVESVKAVEKIANYAESNGTGKEPDENDFAKAGIEDVTSDNIEEIRNAIANLDKEDVDSISEIQEVVDAVVALDKIEDYAQSDTNPAPTVADYITAGVIGVTSENLAEVNTIVEAKKGIDVDTLEELQAIINDAVKSVAAINTISNYAEGNGTGDKPTATTYSEAGLTIPSNTTVAEVNERIASLNGEDVDTKAEIEDVIKSVSALNIIEDYADDKTSDLPTVQNYMDAGVVGVNTSNINEVNEVVEALVGDDVDTLEELQSVISKAVMSVDAINTIATYAEGNGTTTPPTVDTYANAGITIPATTTVEELNERIKTLNKEDVDTVSEIQGVLDAVNALNKIEAYADDSTSNPVPTVEDYQKAGIVGVRAENITLINEAIDNATASEADTVEEVQAIASKADAKVAAFAKIAAYMQDSEINPAPEVKDYAAIGMSGVTEHNLGSVNKMIDDAICSM